MPTIFAIDGAEFADFGAASQAIAALQTGLVALGKGVGDNILRAIVVDGVIGPKTTAATNRALTVHIGSGQAPAEFRTGALSQADVVAHATALANLVDAEALRRGYNVPTSTVMATVAKKAAPASTAIVPYKAPAAAPVYLPPPSLVPEPPADDANRATIIKWSAIGLGLVVATAGIYYAMKRRGGQPTMAGAVPPAPQARTRKGIYYFPGLKAAREYADTHDFPHHRIIQYDKGWAIQLYVSGPYVGPNEDTEMWVDRRSGHQFRGAGLGMKGDRLNDRERELWIQNDENLYNWYQRESRHAPGGMRGFIKRNKTELDSIIRGVTQAKPRSSSIFFGASGEQQFRLQWLPANMAYVVTWGEQIIPILDQRFFTTKGEAKDAIQRAGLKLVGNRVVSAAPLHGCG